MSIPTYLANKNAHPRDRNIQFFEEGHRYLVNGEGGFTSTTTYIHSLFSHFDADAIIAGILKKPEWSSEPTYKYYKMTAKEIADMWKKNGESASGAGTKMHYNIECFFNNMQYEEDMQKGGVDWLEDDSTVMEVSGEVDDDCVVLVPVEDDGSAEFRYFGNFVKNVVLAEGLEPYRTEMLVYDEEVRITGSIDMLYRKKNGEFAIFDWKRSKEISYKGFGGKKSKTPCISHLDDSNFWHYSLQLNIYRRILQKNYGMIVTDLRLVILHPDNSDYLCLTVPFLDEEITALFDARYKSIQKNDEILI